MQDVKHNILALDVTKKIKLLEINYKKKKKNKQKQDIPSIYAIY
jgi:hypothetical protein